MTSKPDLIAGVAGLVLLIAIFLPWFGPSEAAERAFEEAQEIAQRFDGAPIEVPDRTESAWEAFDFVRYVLLLTALVGIRAGIAAVVRSGGGAAVGATGVTAGLGILSTVLVLYRVIDPIGQSGREYGLFLGLIAAAGVALGGLLALEQGGDSRGKAATDSIGSPTDG